MKVVLPLLLLGVSRAAVQCGNFVCFHNAQCRPGPPDFSDHPTGVDGQAFDFHDTTSTVHCECTQFFTGIDCSIPVANCDDGQHRC